ncbi:MAG: DUF368 domain-containing protein [Lachnospiraceae bacterium]|nr:DUF368 domain-containing protein [Lachnospiraceae bacterium]
MKILRNILNGMIIGVANIIPGVSGGTMAVSLGIYDKIISSVTGLRKAWKKSLAFLVPILLGAGASIVLFAKLMEYLLDKQALPTGLTFIGLIFGGLPMLWRLLSAEKQKTGQKGFTVVNVLCFLLLFGVAVALPLLNSHDSESAELAFGVGNSAILFFLGILAAGTMVIPGVSGSMVLMILGYYYGVLNAINGFLDALKAFDFGTMLSYASLLVPFGIGVLIGIVGIAKLIDFLLKRYAVSTYCGVFGLILASPFGILYNTGVLHTKPSAVPLLVGLVLCVLAGIFTYWFSGKSGQEKEEAQGDNE